MATKVFINLPVNDLPKSIAFFKALGFSFNAQFTDDTATCMVVSDTINVMLLTVEKFKEFIPNKVCDARESTEVLVCISRESKSEVDDLVNRAVENGGRVFRESRDHGFMFEHSFQDLDGHVWELVYMDAAFVGG